MSRCRAESFYLSPRDKRSFAQWRVTATLHGKTIEITHRRDLARLSRDPAWDHIVECEARDGSARETHWLDARLVEGHLPIDQRDWTLHRLQGLDPETSGEALLAHLGHRDVRSLAEALYGPAAREGATGPVVRALATLVQEAPAHRATGVMAFTSACASWLDPERVGALIEHAGRSTRSYQPVSVRELAPLLGNLLEPYSPTYRMRLLRDLWTLSTEGEWWNAVHPASAAETYTDPYLQPDEDDEDHDFRGLGALRALAEAEETDPAQIEAGLARIRSIRAREAAVARTEEDQKAEIREEHEVVMRERAQAERDGLPWHPPASHRSERRALSSLEDLATSLEVRTGLGLRELDDPGAAARWGGREPYLWFPNHELTDEQLKIVLAYHAASRRRRLTDPDSCEVALEDVITDRTVRVALRTLAPGEVAELIRGEVACSEEVLAELAEHSDAQISLLARAHLSQSLEESLAVAVEGVSSLDGRGIYSGCPVLEQLRCVWAHPPSRPQLLAALEEGGDAWKVVAAQAGAPLWLVEELAQSPSPEVRAAAAGNLALGYAQDRAGTEVVVAALCDPEERVRRAAHHAMQYGARLSEADQQRVLAAVVDEDELHALLGRGQGGTLAGAAARRRFDELVPGGVSGQIPLWVEPDEEAEVRPWMLRRDPAAQRERGRRRSLQRIACAEGAGRDLHDLALLLSPQGSWHAPPTADLLPALADCSPAVAAAHATSPSPEIREVLAGRSDLAPGQRPASPVLELVRRARAAQTSAEGNLRQKRSGKPRSWPELLPPTGRTLYPYAPELLELDQTPLPAAPEHTLRLIRNEREAYENATLMGNCTFAYREQMEEGTGAIVVIEHRNGTRYNAHLARVGKRWRLEDVDAVKNSGNVPEEVRDGLIHIAAGLRARPSGLGREDADPRGVLSPAEQAALVADDVQEALGVGRGRRARGRRGGRTGRKGGAGQLKGVHLPGPAGLGAGEQTAREEHAAAVRRVEDIVPTQTSAAPDALVE